VKAGVKLRYRFQLSFRKIFEVFIDFIGRCLIDFDTGGIQYVCRILAAAHRKQGIGAAIHNELRSFDACAALSVCC
jgi:hypothetical protein